MSGAPAGFRPDFFTLRRELSGLGLLTRGNGVYWRVVEGAPGRAGAAPFSPPGTVE